MPISYVADVYMNPYEVEVPNYGVNIDVKHFGTQFTCCIANRECPEPRLHFLQGAIGSFFAIQLEYLLEDHDDHSREEPRMKPRKRGTGGGGYLKSMHIDAYIPFPICVYSHQTLV